jgi:hypothetical protein
MLDAVSQVRPEPGQRLIADFKGHLQPSKKDLMVHRVEDGGKIKQGKNSHVS